MSSPSSSTTSLIVLPPTSKDYAHLTAQILAHYDSGSLVLSHRDDIFDILSYTFDTSQDQLEYFTLILSIETDEFEAARNIHVHRDDLQIKTDVVAGTRCNMGLKIVTQGNEYAILMGAQGKDEWEAIDEFIEEVERAGESILAEIEASDEDAEGAGDEDVNEQEVSDQVLD